MVLYNPVTASHHLCKHSWAADACHVSKYHTVSACILLLFMDQVLYPCECFCEYTPAFFPSYSVVGLSRKLTGRTGYLIKDMSLDDVHLRWQGYPSGEVMWIWALSWISLFFNDRAGPEGNQDVCIKPETNTCTLLCRGWCSQLGFDTEAVSLLEIVKKLCLLKDALGVLMDFCVIFSIGDAYYAM